MCPKQLFRGYQMTNPKLFMGEDLEKNLTAKSKIGIAITMQTFKISFIFYNNLIVLVDTFRNTCASIRNQIRAELWLQVGKLEQRLLSLQTAHALRCSTCRPLLTRLQELERRLTQLLDERADHLHDLTQMK